MKPFSQFTLGEALNLLGTDVIEPWEPRFEAAEVSPEFTGMLRKAREHTDLASSEAAKVLLIDLMLLEAVDPISNLKIWKETPLQGRSASGTVDFLLARNAAVLTQPLLAVVEAKEDNFEAGTAQCVVELSVCAEVNELEGASVERLHGIVSNGSGWQFLRWDLTAKALSQSLLFSESDIADLIGVLRQVLRNCAAQLN